MRLPVSSGPTTGAFCLAAMLWRVLVGQLGQAVSPYTLRKYGARGVDLASLVFEPPASRGSAIQTDFCRPSPWVVVGSEGGGLGDRGN